MRDSRLIRSMNDSTDQPAAPETIPPDRAYRGTVYLVGAGPGDPGLLTRRAFKLLRRADVVIHDALVSPEIVRLISKCAVVIDAGKRCGGRQTTQPRINAMLIEWARTARTVVRLKGGDPFVFGRGGEEALALQDAGVPFEVVPGVTAAIGVSAYAGIPLTHREMASSVTFVTGHSGGEAAGEAVDWDALGAVSGTLVIYMGLGRLETITDHLIRAGRGPETPAAIVEWGTYARQRTRMATLATVAQVGLEHSVAPPALVVIGEVAALREQLAWFDRLPLRGTRVLVARSRPQASRLSAALRAAGAQVTEHPLLQSATTDDAPRLDQALTGLTSYDWILFSSTASVKHFWRLLSTRGLDSRSLGQVRVAALGKATIAALRRRGVAAEVAASTFDPGRVAERLQSLFPLRASRVLFPVGVGMTPSRVSERLREVGAVVDELEVFRSEIETSRVDARVNPLDVDLIVLPSSTAARAIADLGGRWGDPHSARVIAIGPSTAQTALACGLPIHGVADDHNVEGVVAAARELIAASTGATAGPTDDRSLSAGRLGTSVTADR